MLQRCPTPRLFAGVRLRGLSIVPFLLFFFSNFSQIPREYTYLWYKIIIIIITSKVNNNNNNNSLISMASYEHNLCE